MRANICTSYYSRPEKIVNKKIAEEETLPHFKQNAELVFFAHNLLHQHTATVEQAKTS
jgi:hypothetical protein